MNAPKQSNVEWVRCYYDAFNRRDWEWIAAMMAPEVEWFHAARDERVKGISAVVASFRSMLDGVTGAIIEPRAIHDAGLVVVAECGIRTAARKSLPPLSKTPSTRPAPIQPPTFCEVLELRAGRCVRGTTYADSVRLLMDISQSAA